MIDGGSNDGSRELLDQYQDAISYWCSEQDNGIYHAMNKGVERSHGDYCLFLNSGDILCDTNVIEKLKDIPFEADIVSCDIYVDGRERKKMRKSVDQINAYWIYDNTLYHQSTWIRHEVLRNCPYHEEYRTISDWIFFFESFTLHHCSYQHIPMAISVFYKGGMSCDPRYHDKAYADKYNYLKNFFPAQYVDDKKEEASFHYVSSSLGRMTKCGRSLLLISFRLIMFVERRFIKPLTHLLQ